MVMVASPTSGFGSYGPVPAKRAARLFEFDIRHPYEPRTQLLEYDELVGKPSAGKAYAYGHDQRIEARFGRHGPAPQADVVEQDVEQAGLAVSPVAVC